jgi:hydrogenase nickel incorporation protein HypB
MCGYCGCAGDASSTSSEGSGHVHAHDHSHDHAHDHSHDHAHDHSHDHAHDHGAHHHHHTHDDQTVVLELGRKVLDKNDRLAERVRGILLGKGICALNLVSSPGSGKTTLLQRTLKELDGSPRAAVLVGDLATDNDARRLRETGTQAVQITTGNVCHLDAHMILHGFEELDLKDVELLLIENVGNLVCPASFDLGEDHRVVLSSVTEGEDKPAKYPTIFHGADAVVITKIDLADAVGVDLEALRGHVRAAAPGARLFEVSARTGVGLDAWLEYVRSATTAKKKVAV